MKLLLQLTDPSFQTQHSGKCDLNLEILPYGINFAVIDKGQDQLKVISQREVAHPDAEKIKELIEAEPVLSNHFRKVKIGFQTPQFTLVPADLFDLALLAEYAKFFDVNDDDVILHHALRSAQAYVVFAQPATLIEGLKAQFHQPQFFHGAAANIETALQLHKGKENPLVLLNFHANFFEVTYTHNGKLLFYNTLPCHTTDEFNYFLLNLLDTLALPVEETDWLLAGSITQELAERLKKYTENIAYADKEAFLKVSESFKSIEAPTFYSLAGLALCE